jgi:hypothetical protein
MENIFGSKAKAREVELLLRDLKPVVRQGFYPSELEKIKEFCQKNNLFLEVSPYKVIMEGEGYSDKGKKVSKDDPKGMFFVYISKNQEKALLANLYETRGDHYNLGLALGYPECCVKFYCEEFEKGNVAPELESYNPLIDFRKRKDDACVISHFPCSPDCKESVKLAEKYSM